MVSPHSKAKFSDVKDVEASATDVTPFKLKKTWCKPKVYSDDLINSDNNQSNQSSQSDDRTVNLVMRQLDKVNRELRNVKQTLCRTTKELKETQETLKLKDQQVLAACFNKAANETRKDL